jgi:hypothetical protein
MPIKTLRGDAIPVAKVVYYTPLGPIVPGTVFSLWCNGKAVTYKAITGDTPASVATAWAAAVAATTIPEFQEVLATAIGSSLSLVAVAAGVPFEITATSSGNLTVSETTLGHGGQNEVHKIALIGAYTGGNFTATWNFGAGNVTTGNIAYNATAAAVQAAIIALSGVGAGQCAVTGGPGPAAPWYVTFTGTLAGTAIAAGTINGAGLTGASSLTIAEVQPGVGLSNSIQYFDPAAQAGSFTLTFNGQTTTGLNANSSAAAVQAALQALSTIGAGNCAVYTATNTGNCPPNPYFVQFTGALAATNVPLLTWSTAFPGGTTGTTPPTQIQQGGQTTSQAWQFVSLGSFIGGTFRMSFNGKTTAAIPILFQGASATIATITAIQSALSALSSLAGVSVSVYGKSYTGWGIFYSDNAFLVGFSGLSTSAPAPLLSIDNSGLTGGAGPSTATVLATGQANVNEIQSVQVNAAGGTFTLTAGAQTTTAIAWNAVSGTVQTRVATDLSTTIVSCTVTGSGTPASPYLITVTSPANTTIALLTGNSGSLTGGTGTITETVAGSAGANEVQTITPAQGVNGGTLTLAFNGSSPTESLAWNATAGQVQSALRSLPTVNTVTVTGGSGAAWVVTWSLTQQFSPQPLIVADGSLLTGMFSAGITAATIQRSAGPLHWDDPTNWAPAGVPGYLDSVYLTTPQADCLYGLDQISTFQVASNVQQVAVSATGGTFTLTSGAQTTAAIAYNATAAQVGAAILAAFTTNALQCTVTGAGTAASPWVITVQGPQGASLPLLTANAGSLTGGAGTVTINAATFLVTGQFALVNGQTVSVTNAGGGLPTGLAVATAYYVSNSNRDTKTFQLAATSGGTPMAVTTVGTGTHTFGSRLNYLEVSSNWTQLLGLDYTNPAGYVEYRTRPLHIGVAAAGLMSINVGTGAGSGSQRINLDTDVDQVALKAITTGGELTPGVPPLLWRNASAVSTLEIVNGDVGVAIYPGESATLASPTKIRSGSLTLGPGATVGTIDQTGGKIVSNGATINGACVFS